MTGRPLFLMTHLGSGWERLAAALDLHPRVQCYATGAGYHHPDDVRPLLGLPHKFGGAAGVWADAVLHNKDFTMHRLCEHYRFVFWAGDEDAAVAELVRAGWGSGQAEDYYAVRAAGLAAYYRRCPRAVWNPPLEADAILGAVA